MKSHRRATKAVVVGAGINGLSTALTWAVTRDAEKEPVILLEKRSSSGGYVTSYERQGFLFDTCQMIPNISEILEFFEVDIDLKSFAGTYARIFIVNPHNRRVRAIELPTGVEDFKKRLLRRYPHNAGQIERFLDVSRAMYDELFKLKVEPSPIEIFKMLLRCPNLIRHSSKTFSAYYDGFKITDPEVREIFDVFAAFSGLPMDRVASIVPISAMNSLLDGAFRPKAGFKALPEALEERFRSLGGEIRLGATVEKVLVDGGKVTGVRLQGGEVIEADTVVTTVDTKVGMEQLVGFDVLGEADTAYAEKARRVRMSPSSINISLGLDDSLDLDALGMDCGYNVITTGGDTFSRLFDDFENGRFGFSEERFHLGVICPSLTTGGRPNITIRVVPVALADWETLRAKDRRGYREKKERVSELFIELVERYLIPDLRKHIIVKDISTPATYARYSGSPSGSIYDMAPYPDNFGRTRLAMRTPIEGLYQPKFVHGVFGSLLSGIQVNDMIASRAIMDGNTRLPKR